MIEDYFFEDAVEIAQKLHEMKDLSEKEELESKLYGIIGPLGYAQEYIKYKEKDISQEEFIEKMIFFAEKLGSIDAQMALGSHYYDENDYANAKKYWEMAAEYGYSTA